MLDLNCSHYCQRDTSLTSCLSNNDLNAPKVYDSQLKICFYPTYNFDKSKMNNTDSINKNNNTTINNNTNNSGINPIYLSRP